MKFLLFSCFSQGKTIDELDKVFDSFFFFFWYQFENLFVYIQVTAYHTIYRIVVFAMP